MVDGDMNDEQLDHLPLLEVWLTATNIRQPASGLDAISLSDKRSGLILQ